MRDIRLLTLYKQHYLDSYERKLDCQVTCLGYYDGLSIQKIEEGSLSCSRNKSVSPVSELWYSTGENICNLKSGCSNQNIGLFRCVSEPDRWEMTERFWQDEESMPFWGLGFVKLENFREYDQIGKRIESERVIPDVGERKTVLNVLTYCTYDNADLVVLVHGNSMAEIWHFFEKTESLSDIKYVHSITGVSEAYLTDCKTEKRVLEEWKGNPCALDESVYQVHIQLVTSGDGQVLRRLKGKLMKDIAAYPVKGSDHISYSYMMGHENISIMIPDTDIRSILGLLIPGGFLTHQNGVYGQGLYNIETVVRLENTKWEDVPDEQPPEKTEGIPSWCAILIKKYQKKMSDDLLKEDESLHSCYQALVQTLNVLDQYEQFSISRDIFYLLFRAFCMFDRQLEQALEELDEDREHYSVRTDKVKESIRSFLDCANSVIYHIVHTDQTYLMIPGCSGTSFAIPIKLNLLYLWFIDRIARILNDSAREYCCILAPVMESRPSTELITFGLTEHDRLICVNLAQRSLYQPRELMLILAHEMAHYIGDDMRDRKLRFECMIRTMAYYIAEGIIPEEYDGGAVSDQEKNLYKIIKEEYKNKIQVTAINWIAAEEKMLHLQNYYADDIGMNLKSMCVNALGAQGNDSVYMNIRKIPESVWNLAQQGKFRENMRYISRVQQQFDKNRRRMLNSGIIQPMIEELLKIYKEAFSDMAAIAILNCEEKDFHDAFYVSEGISRKRANKYRQQKIREMLVAQAAYQKCPDAGDGGSGEGTEDQGEKSLPPESRLLVQMGDYIWVREKLKEYGQTCYQKVSQRVADDRFKKAVEEIRDMFGIFKDHSIECYNLYDRINQCIYDFTQELEKEFRQTRDQMQKGKTEKD